MNIKLVSEKLHLPESVIKRLVAQQTFPDSNHGLWESIAIEKWARSRRGQAILNANKKNPQ